MIKKKKMDVDKNFFNFQGKIGNYLGNMKKGDFICYSSPDNVVKSDFLLLNLIQAIKLKRNTFYLSFTMSFNEIQSRLSSVLTKDELADFSKYVSVFCYDEYAFSIPSLENVIKKLDLEIDIIIIDYVNLLKSAYLYSNESPFVTLARLIGKTDVLLITAIQQDSFYNDMDLVTLMVNITEDQDKVLLQVTANRNKAVQKESLNLEEYYNKV